MWAHLAKGNERVETTIQVSCSSFQNKNKKSQNSLFCFSFIREKMSVKNAVQLHQNPVKMDKNFASKKGQRKRYKNNNTIKILTKYQHINQHKLVDFGKQHERFLFLLRKLYCTNSPRTVKLSPGFLNITFDYLFEAENSKTSSGRLTHSKSLCLFIFAFSSYKINK